MARHTSPKRRTDEFRFPVRIRIRVPLDGLGVNLDRALRWLNEEIGHEDHANWPTEGFHGHATAFHFRTIEDAARFYAAFPMIARADGTDPKRGGASLAARSACLVGAEAAHVSGPS